MASFRNSVSFILPGRVKADGGNIQMETAKRVGGKQDKVVVVWAVGGQTYGTQLRG